VAMKHQLSLLWLRCALVSALLWQGVPLWAAGPSCLGNFKLLAEGLPPAAAEKITRTYTAYNPAAQLGVVSVMAAKPGVDVFDNETLVDIMENFPRGQVLDFNPLKTDEGLFEAIGALTEQGADGVLRTRPGLEKTIRDLAGSDNARVGAALDLFMAKKVGYERAMSFQERIPLPGSTTQHRVADLVEECPSSCDDLPGIHHENKNFQSAVVASPDELANPPLVNGAFQYSDVRLTSLGDEFARDILIHRGTTFQFYRLNFREVNAGQVDIISQVLTKQFETPRILTAIPDETTRDALRDALIGRLGQVLNFHP
jgi:hypothetical protein